MPQRGRVLVLAFVLPLAFGPGLLAETGADSRGVVTTSLWDLEPFVDVQVSDLGDFRGVPYVIFTGRFEGTSARGAYRVPFVLITPAQGGRANGRLLIEPPHELLSLPGRDVLLGNDFVFNRGFSFGSVGWSTAGNSILDPAAADVFIAGGDGGDDPGIIADFARELRSGLPFQHVYAIGYSQSHVPLHSVLHSDVGHGLFDLTLLVGAGTPPFLPPPGPHTPAQGAGKEVLLESEGDLLFQRSAYLRPTGDPVLDENYRVYEVAGGPHIPDKAEFRALIPPLAGSTPLDWSPMLRAVFVMADQWAAHSVPPPPSRILEAPPVPGDVDPVYGFPTGIARDENLNALGGIRLPDVELGRGQFIAVGTVIPVVGDFIDLKCEPLPNGSLRFPSHGFYLGNFVHVLNQLVSERLVLRADARLMLQRAAKSDVGMPGSCE